MRRVALIAVLLLIAPSALFAGEGVRVGIIDFSSAGISPEHLTRFQEGLERSLRAEKADVLSGDKAIEEIKGASVSSTATREIREAMSSLARGKDLYENLSFDEALQELSRACTTLESHIADLESLATLEDTHLYLGMVLQALGEGEKAVVELKRAASLNPGIALDEALYPPSLITAFERARKEVTSFTQAAIFVETQPALGFVYLDGKKKGTSPLTIKDVPLGVHQIVVEKAGFHKKALRIDCSKPQAAPESINIVLKSREGEKAYEGIRDVMPAGGLTKEAEAQVGRHVPGIARSMRADYLVITTMKPLIDSYQASVVLYGGSGDVLRREDVRVSPDPQGMEDAVKGIIGRIRPILQAKKGAGWDISQVIVPARPAKKIWLKNWKVWASVGGAFLVASGASFYGAYSAGQKYADQVDAHNYYVTHSESVDPSILKSYRDNADKYKSQFSTYNTWGYISLTAGSLSFGFGGYLVFSAEGGGSSISLALLPQDNGAQIAVFIPL